MSCFKLKPIFYLNFQFSFSLNGFLVTSTEKLNSKYFSSNIGISINSREKQTSRLSLTIGE